MLFSDVYRRILGYPKSLLMLVMVITLAIAWQVRHFTFDASADTLVVQGDPKLETYFRMTELFGGDEFLVLAYTPHQSTLFDRDVLDRIAALQREVEVIPGVKDVFSILDAPLIKSPPIPLDKMSSAYRTLRDGDVDLELAREELTRSPLFRNYLISPDGQSSVIRIDLERDDRLESLRQQRNRLRKQAGTNPDQLEQAEDTYREVRQAYVDRRSRLIDMVREVRKKYSDEARIYISGVPMIAADMIKFVKSDLRIFGSLVFVLILILLSFFFRRLRWVALPVVISAMSIIITMGILSLAEKPVTVISSNFISLLAIICISFSIHLIVRYRELLLRDPGMNHGALVVETMESKFAPCIYTALTTMLAFGSMMASRILPVEDFGWMMCLGIVISFLVTYSVFPGILLVLGRGDPGSTLGERVELTMILSRFCQQRSGLILLIALAVAIIAGGGLTKISFENTFVDYFDEDTDIYEGMTYIDRHLGGTLPFDVYLQLGAYERYDGEDDFFNSPDGEEKWPERYWFTRDRINTVSRVHGKMASYPATGKVISVATLERLALDFNEGKPLSSVEMAYVLGELPESVRQQLVLPYARPETGYARINARIKESGPSFSRDALITGVREYANDEAGLAEENVIVTGMMVLFDDMLKQLADSQRQTLIYVIAATFFMFALLLRSALLALLALIPNVIAAASVISVMGYTGIPLDMMTITIAAISIGIGVDDAIHYLHRFRNERHNGSDVRSAVEQAHLTIGRAMYFTSVTIIVGFSILVFSNFLPTVYFGLLTALAMFLALMANLTVLPSLLIRCYK